MCVCAVLSFPESGGKGKVDGRFAGGKKILFSLNSGWIERKIPGGEKGTKRCEARLPSCFKRNPSASPLVSLQ